MDSYNQLLEVNFNFCTQKDAPTPYFLEQFKFFIIKSNRNMGKEANKKQTSIKDIDNYPISKYKTLLANLNAYIRMLKNNFPDMSSKQYIKNVHRFIGKIKRKLKFTDQQKLVEARQKIKICTACDCWSGRKPMIQCNLCQDFYHITCLKKSPSSQQRQIWCCEFCDNIANMKKKDKNEYLKRFDQLEQCRKCDRVKKQYDIFIVCMKCNCKYHKNCYGKSNVVCYKCDQEIEKQIKQKQASLFDFNFQRKTQSHRKRTVANQSQIDDFKRFGKQEDIDESTQASTNPYPNFSKNYPQMTKEQIQQYKNGLLYAIFVKQMSYSSDLKPINCTLNDDNEQSLDFGLMFMGKLEQGVYQKYKAQPFGPFKFVYKQNMGYDVVTDKDLPKGMFVCQYVGDVVTYRQVINTNHEQHNDSLFELRAGRNANTTLYIRPKQFTNMGRFINGVNNLTGKNKINVASIRMLYKGKPGIFLFTTRNIKRGQSLAYDYNAGGLNAYSTEHFV